MMQPSAGSSRRSKLKRFGDQAKRIRPGEIWMKKFLLGAVGLVALSFAAPASAADLAARPYTKAPAMIAAVYDWSGFYVGANGGWGTSHNCYTQTAIGGVAVPAAPEGCHDATGGTAGGQVGYRWQSGAFVYGLEAQGNWADLRGSNPSLVSARNHQPHTPRRLRPVHRPDRLCLEQCPSVREGRRCGYRQQIRGPSHWNRNSSLTVRPRRAGARPSVPALNMASLRIGRPPSNTTICSLAARTTPSPACFRSLA